MTHVWSVVPGRVMAHVDARMRRLQRGLILLKAASRVLVVPAAVHVASALPAVLLWFTGTYALLFAAQSLARAAVQGNARRALSHAAAAALLRGDVLRADGVDKQDIEFSVFEGLYLGERLLAFTLPDLIADALSCVAVGVVVAIVLPSRLILLGSAAILVGTVGVTFARRVSTKLQRSTESVHFAFVDALSATIRGRLDIVASGREAHLLARLEAATRAWTAATMRADRVSGLAGRAPMLGAALGAGLVVAVDQMSTGGALTLEVLARGAVLASAVPPFAGLARSVIDLARTRAQLRSFLELLGAPARDEKGTAPVPQLPAALSFDDVRFTYAGGAREALAHASFEWQPPGLLAFAGPNGSGKSTCLRLLLGLVAPDEGRITIGGVDVRSLDLVAWRRRTAYLPQRPYLPERASVREAIKLLAVDADDGAIESALARVELLEALRGSSPDAPLDVLVGTLSTGQRQRVAIARALAQDADVLIFDEPDANLDIAGVARIVRILKDAARDRLVVVAAHTEELVGAANRVVRLTNGRTAAP